MREFDATFERIANLSRTVKQHGSLEDRNRLEFIEGAYRERLAECKKWFTFASLSIVFNVCLMAIIIVLLTR